MSVILVTGAASGLGWAMTRLWHEAGHLLVLADVDAAGLAARTAGLDPDRVLGVVTDVTAPDDLAALVEATRERFGRLDVLVNNAGITHRSPAHRTDPAVFRTVMAVDWQGPVELTMAALPLLRESGGTVVCISSMAGWMPVPGRAAYGAAKAALTQFFEVLRLELEPDGRAGADGAPLVPGHPDRAARPRRGRASHRPGPLDRGAAALGRRHRRAHRRGAAGRAAAGSSPTAARSLASLLWRLAPALYQAQVRRRFADDLG